MLHYQPLLISNEYFFQLDFSWNPFSVEINELLLV